MIADENLKVGALTAERYERLDDLGSRPVAHVIEDIRRDLGTAETLGVLSWKRRRPAKTSDPALP